MKCIKVNGIYACNEYVQEVTEKYKDVINKINRANNITKINKILERLAKEGNYDHTIYHTNYNDKRIYFHLFTFGLDYCLQFIIQL